VEKNRRAERKRLGWKGKKDDTADCDEGKETWPDEK
jgi:hypothetical protein